jgi:ATP-dependent Lon protease
MDWIKNIFRNSHEEPGCAEIEELPEILPVLPLKDAVLLPGAVLPLIVTNPTSASLIREFHGSNSSVAAVGMKKPHDLQPAVWDNLYHIGCMAKITKISTGKAGELSIMIRGFRKVVLEDKVSDQPFMNARVTYLTENLEPVKQIYALALATRDILSQLARLSYQNLDTVLVNLAKIKDPNIYRDMVPNGVNPDGRVNLASLQEDHDLFGSLDLLKGRSEVKDLVDMSFADAAVATLGPYRRKDRQ